MTTGIQPCKVATVINCALWPIGLQHPKFSFFFPFRPRPSALLGNVKNTACVTNGQSQKSELGREAAPIDPIHFVIMLESPHEGGCGLLSESVPATFRHLCQCSHLYVHALSGRPEGPLRHAIAWSSILHSLGKSKAKLCDNYYL